MEESEYVKKKVEDREAFKRWAEKTFGECISKMQDAPLSPGSCDVEVVLKNRRRVYFKILTVTAENAGRACPRYSIPRRMRMEMEKMRRKKRRTESVFAFRKWDTSYGKPPEELEEFWLADFADWKYDEWEYRGNPYALISVELIKQAHPKVLEEVQKLAELPAEESVEWTL